ncbi:MAG: FmdB family zinc ribbon protein [Myxococcaceae bacterium]
MPLFDFRCPACGERFERLVRASDAAALVVCPACDRPGAQRQLSAPARTASGSAGESGGSCVPRGGFT